MFGNPQRLGEPYVSIAAPIDKRLLEYLFNNNTPITMGKEDNRTHLLLLLEP